MFEDELKNWLDKNGFGEIEVFDDDEFLFDIATNEIHFGVVSTSEGIWFAQFAYEYGMKHDNIVPEVLAFLHEIGHYKTIKCFDNTDLENDTAAKFVLGMNGYSQDTMVAYWELPMEFAANVWAIDFVNNNIDAVEEICGIYRKYYEE